MKHSVIALPFFNGRISPLFDVARTFCIVSVDGANASDKRFVDISYPSVQQNITALKSCEVSLIICSAISRVIYQMVLNNGIDVVPGIIGAVDEVVEAYCNGTLWFERYSMPGCRRGNRYRRRGCRRQENDFNFFNNGGESVQ